MNTHSTTPLADQRLILRQQLLAQRQVIAEKMGQASSPKNGYPRSMTMRFLTERPALIVNLLTGLATLLVGRRLIKTISAALIVAKIVQSVAKTHPKKQSPETTSQATVHTDLNHY